MIRRAAIRAGSPARHPNRFQVGVEADLRADLHAFLSGTSDRLLEKLMAVRGTRRGAHLQPGIVRDRELAAGFFTYGPQALRRLRLHHRRRAGPMPRRIIEQLLAQELRNMIADVRLAAGTDQDVVPGRGQGRDAAVEAVEETGTHLP